MTAAVLLNANFLLTAAAIVAMALLVAVLVTVPPGAAGRYLHGRRYHRAGLARHAVRAPEDDAETVTLPALTTTVPDPFAPRTA